MTLLLYWLLSAPLPVLFVTAGWVWIVGVLPLAGIEIDRLLFYSLLWVGVSFATACKGKGLWDVHECLMYVHGWIHACLALNGS